MKFQIGDWTLCTVPIVLQERTILPYEADLVDFTFPTTVLATNTQGFYIRSMPVRDDAFLTEPPGLLRYASKKYTHYYVDLRTTFDEYKAKFSSKSRWTIKHKVEKFAKHCNTQDVCRVYSAPLEMAEFFRLARAVSARSYQERLLNAGLPSSDMFQRELETRAWTDCVRGFVLFCGDKPVSYLYLPARGHDLVYSHLGYDRDYSHLSVGTVLQWHALERLFAERRFRYLDFTEGQGEHKRLLATAQIQCENVMYLRRTWRNHLLVRAHGATDRLSQRLGVELARWGLKTRVRRFIRAR